MSAHASRSLSACCVMSACQDVPGAPRGVRVDAVSSAHGGVPAVVRAAAAGGPLAAVLGQGRGRTGTAKLLLAWIRQRPGCSAVVA